MHAPLLDIFLSVGTNEFQHKHIMAATLWWASNFEKKTLVRASTLWLVLSAVMASVVVASYTSWIAQSFSLTMLPFLIFPLTTAKRRKHD